MDILEEVNDTINERKRKWDYVPMREKSETDALIDELLREFSTESKPGQPINSVSQRNSRYDSQPESYERQEYERQQAYRQPQQVSGQSDNVYRESRSVSNYRTDDSRQTQRSFAASQQQYGMGEKTQERTPSRYDTPVSRYSRQETENTMPQRSIPDTEPLNAYSSRQTVREEPKAEDRSATVMGTAAASAQTPASTSATEPKPVVSRYSNNEHTRVFMRAEIDEYEDKYLKNAAKAAEKATPEPEKAPVSKWGNKDIDVGIYTSPVPKAEKDPFEEENAGEDFEDELFGIGDYSDEDGSQISTGGDNSNDSDNGNIGDDGYTDDGGFDDDYYDESDFKEEIEQLPSEDIDNADREEFEEYIEGQNEDKIRIIKPREKGVIRKKVLRIILTAFIAAFTIIGIFSSVIYCIEQFGSSSSDEKEDTLTDDITDVLQPFVISSIDDFLTADNISDEQLINLGIWEIIVHGDMKYFKDSDSGKINIPHTQVELAVEKLLGVGEVEPKDIEYANMKITYDKTNDCYVLPEEYYVYTTYPKVTNIMESEGAYITNVECYKDVPHWLESKKANPSKKMIFTVKKSGDHYQVLSARTAE